jgi:hypothetical protein
MLPRRRLDSFSGAGCRPLWSYLHTGMLPRLISFVCHSYENTRGAGVFFPFRNSSRFLDVQTFRCAFCIPNGVTGPADVSTCFRPIPFPFTRFQTLLHSPKTQLFSFQAIPNSFAKTPGVGVHPSSQKLFSLPTVPPPRRTSLLPLGFNLPTFRSKLYGSCGAEIPTRSGRSDVPGAR